MEAIIFCGIQASGKSTFYKERFFRTHLRLSMDMLNTRNKEAQFLRTCFLTQQRFVIDNTNPTPADRVRYILPAKEYKYRITGFYFQSRIDEAIRRNNLRTGKELISEAGIRSTFSRMQLPAFSEGFDELYYVRIADGTFEVKPWEDEV